MKVLRCHRKCLNAKKNFGMPPLTLYVLGGDLKHERRQIHRDAAGGAQL